MQHFPPVPTNEVINRERIESAGDYRRLLRGVRPGDILTLYIYSPELEQRQLKTVRVEDR